MIDKKKKYWNDYYDLPKNNLKIPSQFAAFILNEYQTVEKIIEFGCGDGRDSFFFSNYDKKVMGVDYSETAILKNSHDNQKNNLTFKNLNVSDQKMINEFIEENFSYWKNSLIYARFFIHAIDESSENNFLKICDKLFEDFGVLALEFRTNRDEKLQKETLSHFRRFINPLDLIYKLKNMNLKISYFYEGWGFAKYKNDDAYIARLVAERN